MQEVENFPPSLSGVVDLLIRQTRLEQAKRMIANDPGSIPQLKAIVEKYRNNPEMSDEERELMNFIDGLAYEQNVGEQAV